MSDIAPVKDPLPTLRSGYNQEFVIAGQRVFLRTGEYPDGRLGEIFIDLEKAGPALQSVTHLLSICISIGLQYGIRLEEFEKHLLFARFEPAGLVLGHKDISMAASFVDVIIKDLLIHYTGREELKTRVGI